MVILHNPYSGGVMTVDVSKVGRLLQQGWVQQGPGENAVAVVPLGQDEVKEREPAPNVAVAGDDVPKGNATRAVWRDYAEGMGIDTDGMTRAEIRAKVEEETKG